MRSHRRILAAAALSACAALGPAAPAAAQDQPARGAWTLGVALGAGSFSLEDADVPVSPDGDSVGALIYQLHFGGFILSEMALLVGLWGGSHGCSSCADDDQLAFTNLGVALRYWQLDRLWIEAGLGSARTGRIINGDRTWLRSGVSLFGGAGYELAQGQSYAVDAQLRITLASYKDSHTSSSSAALLVGFNWY